MSFDPNRSVSLEEYNSTLRDTVNAYYTHAMNDPNMTQEEAIQSTGEVAEAYLNAVDEFQASQAEVDASEGLGDDAGADAGEGIDDGMDI